MIEREGGDNVLRMTGQGDGKRAKKQRCSLRPRQMGDRKVKAVATGWGIQSDETGKLVREGQGSEPERDRSQSPETGIRIQGQESEPRSNESTSPGGIRTLPGEVKGSGLGAEGFPDLGREGEQHTGNG